MMALFDRLAGRASDLTGHPLTFAAFMASVLVWLVVGPLVSFSNAWQLTINTATTIATTALVLLLQHSQNADSRQRRAAISELVHALPDADDRKAPDDEPER